MQLSTPDTDTDATIKQEWQEPEQVQISSADASPGRAVTEVQWTCTMDLTGRGVRGEIELELEVQVLEVAGMVVRMPVAGCACMGAAMQASHTQAPRISSTGLWSFAFAHPSQGVCCE